MAKTAGKGTTVSYGGTAIGAGLVIEVTPFPYSLAEDDITAIDSVVTESAGSIATWGAATGSMYWDKADPAQDAMKTALGDETEEAPVIITRSDGSTETATCLITQFDRGQHSRTGRVIINFALKPVGAVTLADGV